MTSRGLILPGAFPVVHDLLAPEGGPFTDELSGARLQASSKHCSVHGDRGATASMVCMEVGYWVIPLVPVHVDHHSIKRANTRHATTTR